MGGKDARQLIIFLLIEFSLLVRELEIANE